MQGLLTFTATALLFTHKRGSFGPRRGPSKQTGALLGHCRWMRPGSAPSLTGASAASPRPAGRWSCAAVGVIKSGKTLISSAPSLLFFSSFPLPLLHHLRVFTFPGERVPHHPHQAPSTGRATDATQRSFHTRTSIAGSVRLGPAAAAALQRDLDCVSAGFSSATGINSHQFQSQIRTFRKRGASAKKFLSCPPNPLQ